MDEIEYAIQGYIDKLRMDREFAYGIMLSSGNMGKAPKDKTEVFPLPYDHELGGGKMSADDILATYKIYYPEYNGN